MPQCCKEKPQLGKVATDKRQLHIASQGAENSGLLDQWIALKQAKNTAGKIMGSMPDMEEKKNKQQNLEKTLVIFIFEIRPKMYPKNCDAVVSVSILSGFPFRKFPGPPNPCIALRRAESPK